jgi:predicted TIM-barrel enzyme/DNA-binding NtrC family response regulator
MNKGTQGNFLIGAAVGSGISARAAEDGGADFLIAINAGRLRNMGVPSITCMLPTHNAGSLSLDVALNEVLPQTNLPVLLGVNCWEENFDAAETAKMVRDHGFAGAVNFPTTMLYSFGMRRLLDNAGIGHEREVEMLLAVQAIGLMSLCFCGTRSQAKFAAQSGLNMILLNFGWNAGGKFGHGKRQSLEEMGAIARDVGRLVKRTHPNCQFLLEGGGIVSSEDLGYVAEHAPIDGYVGGSTLDRLPFEAAVSNKIAGYKHATEARNALSEAEQKTVLWAARFSLLGQSPRFLSFLIALQGMVSARSDAVILAEIGQNVEGVVRAFAAQHGKATITIDVLEEPVSSHVIRKLLGYASDRSFSSGVLTDENTGLVVIKNCQAMPATSQRRLASVLTSRQVVNPKTRRLQPVIPRVLFIFRQPLADDGQIEGIVSELHDCLKGWVQVYPPLRERASDISILYEAAAEGAMGKNFPMLTPAAVQVCRAHGWSENDVELASFVGLIAAEQLKGTLSNETAKELIKANSNKTRPDVISPGDEKKRVVDALWKHGFHRGKTAEFLGVSRKTLYNKIVKYGLGN